MTRYCHHGVPPNHFCLVSNNGIMERLTLWGKNLIKSANSNRDHVKQLHQLSQSTSYVPISTSAFWNAVCYFPFRAAAPFFFCSLEWLPLKPAIIPNQKFLTSLSELVVDVVDPLHPTSKAGGDSDSPAFAGSSMRARWLGVPPPDPLFFFFQLFSLVCHILTCHGESRQHPVVP